MTGPRIGDDAVLAVGELSVVPEGDQVIVGDPARAVFVALPPIGAQVLELLRAGATVGEARVQASALAGEDVDVADFVTSLVELGFLRVADDERPSLADGVAPPPRPRRPNRAFSPAAWTAYAACAIAAVALYALDPRLLPRATDVFFLDTPVRSIAALTLMTYVLAFAHEGCHWLAARAAGVSARIAIGRRLYFLALEIDLSGLWSLPRRQRYGPLLAGMAFDGVVLAGVLVSRYGDGAGWWHVGDAAGRALAAIAFIEVTAIVSQCWIFLRTDLYAVLVTATGCVNLLRVNALLVRRALRRITPEQRDELAAAPARDLAVARWYRWIHALGMLAAAAFFVVLFAPATIQLLSWVGETVSHGDVGSVRFWEALAFGLVIVSPRLLTLGVAVRDVRGWLRRRARLAPS